MPLLNSKIILNCAGYEYEQLLLIHHDQQNAKDGEDGMVARHSG